MLWPTYAQKGTSSVTQWAINNNNTNNDNDDDDDDNNNNNNNNLFASIAHVT